MTGSDLREGIGEICLRIDAIQFRGLQDRIYRGGALAAGMTAGEEAVASSQGNASDCVFGDVVVGFEASVGGKARQRNAALDDVAQSLSEVRSGREFALGSRRPGEERIEQRDERGAMCQPFVWRGEACIVLYCIELGDPIERRLGDGGFCRLPHVGEGSAAMGPAGDLGVAGIAGSLGPALRGS